MWSWWPVTGYSKSPTLVHALRVCLKREFRHIDIFQSRPMVRSQSKFWIWKCRWVCLVGNTLSTLPASQENKTIATTEESKDRGSLLDSGSVMTKGSWQNIPSLRLAGTLWSISGSPREAGYSNTPGQELQQQLCVWVSRLPCTLPGRFCCVSWPCDKHNHKCNSFLELWRLSSKLPFSRRVWALFNLQLVLEVQGTTVSSNLSG